MSDELLVLRKGQCEWWLLKDGKDIGSVWGWPGNFSTYLRNQESVDITFSTKEAAVEWVKKNLQEPEEEEEESEPVGNEWIIEDACGYCQGHPAHNRCSCTLTYRLRRWWHHLAQRWS